jgi:hypothetical protein
MRSVGLSLRSKISDQQTGGDSRLKHRANTVSVHTVETVIGIVSASPVYGIRAIFAGCDARSGGKAYPSCRSPRRAGPSRRDPVAVNLDPCSGQSQLSSASFHDRIPPRCGQTADTF